MKTADWLRANTTLLKSAGIPTARLDCLVLLEDATHKNRAYLLAHPELELTRDQLSTLTKQVTLRQNHQPLAFIRGKTEFYGREFTISSDVLEPRPESETIIDLLLSLGTPASIVDVGCGSGALGITAKLELPSTDVTLVDIDPACLEVTRQNAHRHDKVVTVSQSNLLENVTDATINDSVLLANLPYVPDNFTLNQAAMNEPRLAIFGGPDGLDLYRHLFQQIQTRNLKPQAILCESLPIQHEELRLLASNFGFRQINEADFIQVFSSEEPLQA